MPGRVPGESHLPLADARPLAVLGLSLYGPRVASHRVRLAQYRQGLAQQGIVLQLQSLLELDVSQPRASGRRLSPAVLIASVCRRLQLLRRQRHFDLAILYAELAPLLPARLEQRLLRLPYILDLDDAFYLKYRSGRLACFQPFLAGKLDRLMVGAAAITAGNAHLAAYARRFNPRVVLLPSVVDTAHYRPAESPPLLRTPAVPFTVGWIGSPSTAPYLQELAEPLRRLALERPVRLMVVGAAGPAIPGVELIEIPWNLEDEVAQIRRFDVGVMPLPPTPWAEGKCAYKLIQCMACAVPVIASAVGANLDVVPPSCGVLVRSSDDWLQALSSLAADPGGRERLGAAGRRWVEERYSLRSALPVMADVIRQVARSHD